MPRPAVTLRTWEEAVSRLEAGSSELQTAIARLDAADAQQRLALSPLLPSLRTSVSAQESLVDDGATVVEGAGGGSVNVGGGGDEQRRTSPLVALRASAFQSLVDIATWKQLSAAIRRERAAKATLHDSWRLMLVALSRALVAVVSAERVVELDLASVRQAAQRHSLALAAERLGTGRRLDTLRIERDLEVARGELLTSIENLRRARESLGLALGLEEELGVAPGFKLDGLRKNLAQQCSRLETGAPRADVRAAAELLEAERKEVSAGWAAFAPTLGLQSSFTALTVDPGFADVSVWNVAAVLQFPLFEGGARFAEVSGAKAEAKIAEQSLAATQRAVSIERVRAERALTLAAKLVEAARKARNAAALTDQLTAEAFREGVGTSLELVQSAAELREAQRAMTLRELELVQAEVDWLMVEAECPRS